MKVFLRESREHLESLSPSTSVELTSIVKAIKSTNQALEKGEILTSIFSDAMGTVLYVLGSKAITPESGLESVSYSPLAFSQMRPREVQQPLLSSSLVRTSGTFEPESDEEDEEEKEEKTVTVTTNAKTTSTKRLANLIESDSDTDPEFSTNPNPISERGRATGTILPLDPSLLDEAPHRVYGGSETGDITPVTSVTPFATPRRSGSLTIELSDSESDSDVELNLRASAMSLPATPISSTSLANTMVIRPGALTALIIMTRRTDAKVLATTADFT